MKRLLPIFGMAAVSVCCSPDTVVVRPGQDINEAIRSARKDGHPDKCLTVKLVEGVYSLTSHIVLGPQDSHLRIVGAGMGKTVISGGREQTGHSCQNSGRGLLLYYRKGGGNCG